MILEVGYDNGPATDEEMERMRGHVKDAMEEGAMGIGSSLIYALVIMLLLRNY